MEILNYGCSLSRSRLGWVTISAAALGIITGLGYCVAAGPPQQPIDEYQVKAAFLYNFVKFVQWPSEAFQSLNQAIKICVLGQDPFGGSLENTVAGRAIEGRSLIVRHISSAKDVAGCQVLFISSAENNHVSPILAEIGRPGVLTIGDSVVSGTNGVVINFKLEDAKVRFEINVDAAEGANLHISSRLLTLAHIIESNRNK